MYKWEPADDITAYELAFAVGLLISSVQPHSRACLQEALEELPPEVRRHFLFVE